MKPTTLSLPLLILLFSLPSAQAAPSCAPQFLNLLKSHDYRSYQVYEGLSNKNDFFQYMNCGKWDGDIFAAIHEGIHGWDYDQLVYHLDSGDSIEMPEEGAGPAPRLIAREVSDSPYHNPYFTDTSAESSKRLRGLLEEMNGYTRELISAARLIHKLHNDNESTSQRDGVANMMYFVKIYLYRVGDNAGAWNKLINSLDAVNALRRLWFQADMSLQMSCPIPSLGMDDRKWIQRVYSKDKNRGIAAILGKAPEMPAECGGK
jgi:hypothetical protein